MDALAGHGGISLKLDLSKYSIELFTTMLTLDPVLVHDSPWTVEHRVLGVVHI